MFLGWFAAPAVPCGGLAAEFKDNRSNGLEIGSFPTRWQRPSDGHALHSTFSVIYWYLDNTGKRKQKWDTLETRKEAKQRKAFVEYYQEKYGYVLVPLEEQFARQIEDSKKSWKLLTRKLHCVTS